MKYAIGAASFLVLSLVIGACVLASGAVNISALEERGWLDSLLGYASRRSIEHHATAQQNPFAGDAIALSSGLAHYKENCLACHAVAGSERTEFAKGLHPPAPMLTASGIQGMTDGELFWVVSNGIGMTGMPAFSPTHDENELWHIVAFVRHLPKLSDEERSVLAAGQPEESEHHHEGTEDSHEHNEEHHH